MTLSERRAEITFFSVDFTPSRQITIEAKPPTCQVGQFGRFQSDFALP
ncbi:hypothetical protein COLO4_36282 [Corchorus olitorius]|uniref:Uncharacterized protein n=1 Tax=Corchorus olitorius TaxID=93759 RepID=A0A1R3GA75_9ROSI|nr:hypothetical protein COLO4_36282 [Corchorus olitorius]